MFRDGICIGRVIFYFLRLGFILQKNSGLLTVKVSSVIISCEYLVTYKKERLQIYLNLSMYLSPYPGRLILIILAYFLKKIPKLSLIENLKTVFWLISGCKFMFIFFVLNCIVERVFIPILC